MNTRRSMNSFILFLTGILSLLSSCQSMEENAQLATPVTVMIAESGIINRSIVVYCRLEAGQEAMISAFSPGRILEVNTSVGDSVQEGDLLVELSTDQRNIGAVNAAAARIAAASAVYSNAEADLERSSRLLSSGVISESEYERSAVRELTAEAALQGAYAAYSAARSTDMSGRITAPFSGSVTRVWAREGETTGGPMISIADSSLLKAELLAAPRHLSYLEVGQSVAFTTSHHSGIVFPGAVTSVSPAVDPVSGLVSLTIQLHDRSGLLRSGMTGTAFVNLETVPDAVVLPQSVMRPAGDNARTVALLREGHALIVPIETGIASGTDLEVTAGVSPGDTVIVMGSSLVSSGDIVRVVE